MHALKACSRRCRLHSYYDLPRRGLATASDTSATPTPAPSLPWFVDPSEVLPKSKTTPSSLSPRVPPPHLQARLAPLPTSIPSDSPIARLHAALRPSPHLEPGELLVREPIYTAIGPPLPKALPKGKRKRGGTYAGEGIMENNGGIWNWIVVAQVKEGTEKRGAIESVMRVVRKALLTANPPLALPPNHKRRDHDGWAMIDAGDFAKRVVICRCGSPSQGALLTESC
ncbi:hypothetical protein A0H81_04751 [Grifola frondosa]|uniref:Uncharacterized protein n=1 Tax=Grifola frondosa TaxID=5627 RepID=A0A1C7MGB1_GRIFR|nr:hypothetical protein A0H81_04751 [Grifola frondosa]